MEKVCFGILIVAMGSLFGLAVWMEPEFSRFVFIELPMGIINHLL